MKKTYVYFLVPLLALIIFGAIYWNYVSTYDAKEETKRVAAKEKKDEALRIEAQKREKAIQDALTAQDKRKKEREAKDAQDKADHDARDAAIEARRKAYNEKEKFSRQVDRLKNDVRVETEAITKLEETKKNLIQDEAFLKTYVTEAEANSKKLGQIVEQIAAADAAAKAAADAAAAAAKAKNS